MKKFFKTTIVVEILSETEYNTTDLEQIAYDISEGNCSGRVEATKYEELTPQQAAKELLDQGSDPEFFNLDSRGNDLDDDIIGYQVEDRSGKHEIHPDMDGSFCIYNWSQCEEMILNDTDFWKIVPVLDNGVEDATRMFEGNPND